MIVAGTPYAGLQAWRSGLACGHKASASKGATTMGLRPLLASVLAVTALLLAGASPSDGADPGTVDICGPLNFYSPATATTNNQIGVSGVTYQLVLSGSVPPDLGARSTALNPEIVRLTGRLVQGINTVADYTVARVPSCAGLPNTSTSSDTQGSTPMLAALSITLLTGLVVLRLRLRRI
jgi:hypothetical protein